MGNILLQIGLGGINDLLAEIELITTNEIIYLFTLILAISIGMLVIWYLYKKLAKRDMFELKLKTKNGERLGIGKGLFITLTYILKYIFLFPIFVMIMFVVLSLGFLFMSSGLDLQTIFFLSIALISVVRLLAYIKEDTAQEIAKMIPFALISSILLNPKITEGYNFPPIREVESALAGFWIYFVFIFIFEISLRVIYRITRTFKKEEED